MKRRLSDILKELRLTGHRTIADLAVVLDVSEETIRRDLKRLSKEGLIEKHHGSASLRNYSSEPSFEERYLENRDMKEAVATLAAGAINNGDVVFLDIGTTTAFVAHALKDHRDLTIVTNSVVIANIMFDHNGFKTYMTGGEVRAHDGGLFGPEAIDFIDRYCINKAVLSTAAIHHDHGFLTHHLCEAELYSKVAKQAEVTLVCADATKYNKRAPIRLFDFDDVDVLFSDKPPAKALRKSLAKKNVNVRLIEGAAELNVDEEPEDDFSDLPEPLDNNYALASTKTVTE